LSDESKKLLLFEDGILVKRQKSERDSGAELKKSQKKQAAEGQSKKYYQTNVVLLQKAQGVMNI